VYKDRGSLQLTLSIHLMELVYFCVELSKMREPTIKAQGLCAVVCVIPALLVANMNQYTSQHKDGKDKSK
jgi:hypothetical protein